MSKTLPQANKTATPSSLFFSIGLDMSWRLAMAVLIPIIAGAELDQHSASAPFGLIIGFALAIVGAVLTIRRTMQLANDNPVLNNIGGAKHD